MKRENLSDCINILALGALFLAAALSGCAAPAREDRSDFGDREYRAIERERRSEAPKQQPVPMPKPVRQRAR